MICNWKYNSYKCMKWLIICFKTFFLALFFTKDNRKTILNISRVITTEKLQLFFVLQEKVNIF